MVLTGGPGAVDGRAAVQEAQPVEIGVSLDIDRHLGIASGHADVVEDDVADRLGDVIVRGIAPVSP